MNLEFLQDVLQTISVAGIGEAIFLVDENDDILVSGIDDNNSVVVFSRFGNSNFLNKSVGVHRIPVLINRLKLFNLDSAKTEISEHNDYTHSIMIKEGRKSASFTFANPKLIRAPKSLPEDNIRLDHVIIDRDKLNELIKAKQALNPEFIKFRGEGNNIIVELSDQVNDKYEDKIGINKSGDWNYKWKADKLLKLVKHELSNKNNENVKMVIDRNGFLKFMVNNVQFILPRQS